MRRMIMALLASCEFVFFAPVLPAKAVTIDWVHIGDPGNAADTLYVRGEHFGAVGYAYNIGRYEVTVSQYADFLNAKDPNGTNSLSLYNIGMSNTFTFGGINCDLDNPPGSKYIVIPGTENHPVNSVGWMESIRFANWLNNGQGNGDTESGAYTLLGPLYALGVPSNYVSLNRSAGAHVFLPSEDEWYKAAYYAPSMSSYYLYATGSNTAPAVTAPPGGPNSTNRGSGSRSNDVGAYSLSASPYGTFDQGGNHFEWVESWYDDGYRVARGGAAADWMSFDPGEDFDFNSFRVASTAEPTSMMLVASGFIGGWLFLRRRTTINSRSSW